MDIPFISFNKINEQIRTEIFSNFESFYDSKTYVLGDQVRSFENNFANYCEVGYCVGVGNGSDAIRLALEALNVGEGDEVIVPSNTYIGTVLAVSHTGATPVFVEPNIKTYNIDTERIEASITIHTKAIVPVHLYGQPCQMDVIMSIAQQHNLYVVEDNAQAQGAVFNGEMTGSFGDINATSFYPTKNLGSLGDAGAITTNDIKLMKRCQSLRNYGSIEKNNHQEIGYNTRLDELQAGILDVKLGYLNDWNEERRKIARWYINNLKDIKQIILPHVVDDAISVYHLFVIRVTNRDRLQKHLYEHGVQTMIHYPVSPHLQPSYKELGYKVGDFPVAEELASTSLSLPIFVGMTKAQVHYVSVIIEEFLCYTKLK